MMRSRGLGVALADGVRDALRFWPLILAAFLYAILSCLLLGLSLQQVGEAREVSQHLQRWDREGAASLQGLYLAGSAHDDGAGTSDAAGAPPLQDGPVASSLEPDEDSETAADPHRAAALLALLADPQRTAYTVDPYGDRFGDDLPGAILTTEDLLPAAGLDTLTTPTGQSPPRGADGAPAPYAVLGSASTARDPYALLVDGALPPPTRVRFQDAMIPVVGRLAPGATMLDPTMGSVPLDGAVLVIVPPSMLPSLYDQQTLDALLLRTVALGPGAPAVLDAAARPLERENFVVTAEPLSSRSSGLLQSLSSSSRTLLVLFGSAVLGAGVSLFGTLGVLARALAPTWRIAVTVGASHRQTAVRILVPVLLAWVLPAGIGLTAGAAVLPGPPPTGPVTAALAVVLGVGTVAALSSWRALAATFGGGRPGRRHPVSALPSAPTKEPS